MAGQKANTWYTLLAMNWPTVTSRKNSGRPHTSSMIKNELRKAPGVWKMGREVNTERGREGRGREREREG